MTDFDSENPDCGAKRFLRCHRHSDCWLGSHTNYLRVTSDWQKGSGLFHRRFETVDHPMVDPLVSLVEAIKNRTV